MTEVDGDLFGVAGLRSQLVHVVSHCRYHPVTIHLDGNWGRSRSCQPFAPAWHGNPLLVLGRAHELHVAHPERRRQLIEAHHRRVATTSLSSESALELADLRMLEPPL